MSVNAASVRPFYYREYIRSGLKDNQRFRSWFDNTRGDVPCRTGPCRRFPENCLENVNYEWRSCRRCMRKRRICSFAEEYLHYLRSCADQELTQSFINEGLPTDDPLDRRVAQGTLDEYRQCYANLADRLERVSRVLRDINVESARMRERIGLAGSFEDEDNRESIMQFVRVSETLSSAAYIQDILWLEHFELGHPDV
ncbi:hypothetical protein CC1G_14506 [Coprinopsis cinerea okayama7|uniref:Uncharacterized protein n=1 Tax=Coprinopsis cinerea (strain Okayama-7 / 130 / ATCC MYA-4618 / FGSC 9003) TaxID=240176 RepID=D6RLW6_COPC7|nr:hypothetical protein CC1G_14506 [Coprinopsis cinerea okayama7\|eukprot:XP_002911508.1 hypothetical protein CC1G_14506 [Coprinopsis cinerea okayama7\